MREKRYQVFISSTSRDLLDERQAVVQAVLTQNAFPAGMELFPASNADQWELIKSVIDDSDYYLLILGGRYGSMTSEGISYTEMEFDYALQIGKPILAFVHEAPDEIPAGKTDQNDLARKKLDEFRTKVLTGRLAKHWRSSTELQLAVTNALSAESKRNPQEGWVRASQAVDPETAALLKAEIAELKGRQPQEDNSVYQGGEDEIDITVLYQPNTYRDPWMSHTSQMTWDQVFREVGPIMLHEATESQIRLRIAREALFYADKNDVHVSHSHERKLQDELFNTIKIQLYALGLIERGTLKRPVSDKNVYWKLTRRGEDYLMRLRALKREPN